MTRNTHFLQRMVRKGALGIAIALALAIRPALAGGADTEANLQKLKQSLEKWTELKAKCGGNYSYTVRWQSWVGFGNETVIVVRTNKVLERKYAEFSNQAVPGEKWLERGEALGRNKKGAPPRTLDQLYQEAEKILTTRLSPGERLYLNFDKQGLLKDCFYVDTRIMDDAPHKGVTISSLTLEGISP
jgi:hypothetical protein